MTATHVVLTDQSPPASQVLRVVGAEVPLVVLTGRMVRALEIEFHCYKRAVRFLVRLATELNKPIVVNAPTGGGDSQSLIIGPRDWTRGKTAGWIAVYQGELEREFGAVAKIEWGEQA